MIKRIICWFKQHEFKDTLNQYGLPGTGWVHVECGRCGLTAKAIVGEDVNKYAHEHRSQKGEHNE